jgi:hypothetical protein
MLHSFRTIVTVLAGVVALANTPDRPLLSQRIQTRSNSKPKSHWATYVAGSTTWRLI